MPSPPRLRIQLERIATPTTMMVKLITRINTQGQSSFVNPRPHPLPYLSGHVSRPKVFPLDLSTYAGRDHDRIVNPRIPINLHHRVRASNDD